ncbi:2-C-methyl-D-erythritol 4-phosphate cytidylyltransferase [bacterium]|nr:2-C-methyl-D-erythritol 4-phosphate cytidylyltransferase [bacterium]
MKASAIIVAAGSGVRLGYPTPKAFVPLGGAPLLRYALAAIAQVETIGEAVVTLPPGMESAARAEIRHAGLDLPVKLTPGGAERQDSVRIALELTSALAEVVVIHDAARPFATPASFAAAITAAARAGAAIAAIPLADTLKRVSEPNLIVETVPRANLWLAQTPQAFRRDLLVEAHRRALAAGIVATDDADLVQRLGAAVEVVPGASLNFKITTAQDLAIAAAIVAARADRPEPPRGADG